MPRKPCLVWESEEGVWWWWDGFSYSHRWAAHKEKWIIVEETPCEPAEPPETNP